MSGSHSHDNMVPSAAIALGGFLVVASLALTAAVRADILPASPTAPERRAEANIKPVAERILLFADGADGSVRVTDVATRDTVAVFGQDGSGFIRGVMRGLARERRMHGFDSSRPFKLTLYADTQLVLTDTATGRLIELNGFGGTNRTTFLKLLSAS